MDVYLFLSRSGFILDIILTSFYAMNECCEHRKRVTFGFRPPAAASYLFRIHSNVSVHSDRRRPCPKMQLRFSSSTPTTNRRGHPYLQTAARVTMTH